MSRTPSARTIARLMTIGRDALTKAETVNVATVEGGVPLLVGAREIIAAFQVMVRKKSAADLETWLERSRSSLVASFANEPLVVEGWIEDRSGPVWRITDAGRRTVEKRISNGPEKHSHASP